MATSVNIHNLDKETEKRLSTEYFRRKHAIDNNYLFCPHYDFNDNDLDEWGRELKRRAVNKKMKKKDLEERLDNLIQKED